MLPKRVQARAGLRQFFAGLWRLGPPLTGLFAIAGIVLCNRLTMFYKTLPAWMVTPAISFTGILYPTRWLYLACFGSVALSFALMAWPMYDYARSRVAPSVKCAVHGAFVLAFVAFGGLFLQAACPIQADLITQMAQLTDAHSAQVMRESLTLQTWLHQVGAVAFFLGSVLHGFCILYVYGYVAGLLPKAHHCPPLYCTDAQTTDCTPSTDGTSG